jgi:hypothetical protein
MAERIQMGESETVARHSNDVETPRLIRRRILVSPHLIGKLS